MNIPDSNWWYRSSFCGNGACLEAFRAGQLVLVRDSKQAPAVAVIQQWTAEEWEDLLNAIKRNDVHHTAVRWLSAYGDALFGLHRHEKLTFTGEEWDAFLAGVRAGEFRYELLPSYASTLSTPAPTGGQVAGEVGPGADGPDQVATGAGGPAELPVPVAAQPAGDPEWAEIVARTKAAAEDASDAVMDAYLLGDQRGAERSTAPALWDPASPQHTVIRAAIAWRNTVAESGEYALDDADALIRAVDALPHIGEREPEPAWGSGPLVEHNPDPEFCRHCGHACNHTPRHELVDGPGGPMCKDKASCVARHAADRS